MRRGSLFLPDVTMPLEAFAFAPGEEPLAGAEIRLARVRVLDRDGDVALGADRQPFRPLSADQHRLKMSCPRFLELGASIRFGPARRCQAAADASGSSEPTSAMALSSTVKRYWKPALG